MNILSLQRQLTCPRGQSLSRRFARNWTPAALGSALAVWLDADDASTIVLNGSNVNQWNDKSGNARHVSQGTAARQPIYNATGLNGKPTIDFQNSRFLLSGSNSLGTVTQFNAVAVWRTNASGASNYDYLYQISTSSSALSLSVASTIAGAFNGNYYFLTNATGLTAYDSGSPAIFNQATITSHILKTTSLRNNLWVNGSSRTLSGDYPQAFNGNGDFFIGANWQPGQYVHFVDGYVAEIIFVINDVLTTADRQRLEGYLAWKWGLEANLPAGHPFRNTPPTV